MENWGGGNGTKVTTVFLKFIPMRGLPVDSNNTHPVDRLTKNTIYFLWENMGLARNVSILGRAGAGRASLCLSFEAVSEEKLDSKMQK